MMSVNSMKITYDASLLGLGPYGTKTGLFRVAPNLIAELWDQPLFLFG